jgi:hypothetical protein
MNDIPEGKWTLQIEGTIFRSFDTEEEMESSAEMNIARLHNLQIIVYTPDGRME